ncbi:MULTISPECIES: BPSL0761 family protein [Paraburkholderia]|uniref:BPSL0761 family protein n=1 Tax=Paraburkholderia TaxID=1822464 RepID=UPI0027DF7B0F|nr:BPSL0761 family protein [Paraburkholderia aspalathi]
MLNTSGCGGANCTRSRRTPTSPNACLKELMMKTPYERTKAVVDTREMLEMLASADEITIGGLVQSVAIGLLRHYPLNIDLDVSAAALPGVWAPPER